MNKIISSRRAQSGETVTWIIATLIIVAILLIAIYASFALAKGQKIITTGKNPSILFNSKYSGTSDLIATKSLTGFLSTKEDEQIIYSKINQGFDDSNGNLAVKIFEPLKNDYSSVWLGIDENENNYFGKKPGISINEKIQTDIKLNEDKDLQLVLVK